LSTITDIHRSPQQFVLAITGGGSAAISDLLSEPGASATVLEAIVPYHSGALSRFLGRQPDSAVSSETARSLAMVAWLRAKSLSDLGNDQHNLIGLGATTSLSTDRTRKGENQCFIALQSANETTEISLHLVKGRSRQAEERLVADVILHLIARASGVDIALPVMDEIISERSRHAVNSWAKLHQGSLSTYEGEHPIAVFPGAFNPLHQGHRDMVAVAEASLNQTVHLEISIRNVDKPPIDFLTMSDRAKQIDYPLIFSNAPTFIEKAEAYPGATFIVGADTMLRIADSRYYDDLDIDTAINKMAASEISFLVFGRVIDNQFSELADLALPDALMALCTGVRSTEFRSDISSSDMRRGV